MNKDGPRTVRSSKLLTKDLKNFRLANDDNNMSMHGHISPFTSGGSTRRPSFYPITARSSIFPGSTEASRRNSLSVEKPDLRLVFKKYLQNVIQRRIEKVENIKRYIPGTLDHQEHQMEKVFLEVTMQE